MAEQPIDPRGKLGDAVMHIADTLDADPFFYAGEISQAGYNLVCDCVDTLGTKKRKNAALFLNTLGGHPHAAYRLARAFGHHYERLTLYVFGPCKSAGTLLALGFDDLVIGDRGELGPMDVQLANRDEILEYNSGLDQIQAMDWLQKHAKASFKDFLQDMRMGERLSTKAAGEMARQLTQGLFAGMYAHMDPVRLGYVQRTMLITEAYGTRLNNRSHLLRSEEALRKLVYQYPTHDFVIDRAEARNSLFDPDRVRCPTPHENALGTILCRLHPGTHRDIEFMHLLQIAPDKPVEASADAPPIKKKGQRKRHQKLAAVSK